MNRLLLMVLASISIVTSTAAQVVKFKEDKVWIDSVACMNYQSNPGLVDLETIDGKQTIFIRRIEVGLGDDTKPYSKVTFVEQDRFFISGDFPLTKKSFVKRLVKEGVLNNCEIDEEKLNRFILKYDESLDGRLMGY